MRYTLDLSDYKAAPLTSLGADFAGSDPSGSSMAFNNYYMEKDHRPFYAVSGEFHYSRMDERRWEDELIKMRLGGVNVVATYLFWNHIEEDEGVFDFTGRRDLRRFVELCKKHGLYVILRVGPFDHGEVRNGGLPDWLYGKPFQVRHTNEGFMACVRRLYSKIGEQVKGLFYQDGGSIIAVQLDNEYMQSSACWEMTTGISNEWVFAGDEGEEYILQLRKLALECGLTPVFFTGTAWGTSPYSERVMPVWGGYGYRPWIFYSHKGEHPATEEYVYRDYHHSGNIYPEHCFSPVYEQSSRPYACCEMGAGMMCCYYYRFIFPYKSVDAFANIKIASGCNFIGYYMFQGGTNPIGKHGAYLNEAQVSKLSYDYQAALGEFGQVRESYKRLKSIHHFTRCFGERLAPMETVLPQGASEIDPNDTQTLRFAVRTDGESGFLFINNFQDHVIMPDREREEIHIRTKAAEYDFAFGIAAEENAILPFHFDMDGILLRQANAQPVLRTVVHGRLTYVFMVVPGMDGAFRFEPGISISGDQEFFTVSKADVTVDVLVISREQANEMYLLKDGSLVFTQDALLEDEQGRLRLETVHNENTLHCYPPERLEGVMERKPQEGPLGTYHIGVARREIPVSVEQTAPYRWVLRVQANALDGLKDARLQIDYRGDIGSLFLKNVMISDNFCNEDTWEVGLMEQRKALDQEPMVLAISPLREGAVVHTESAMADRNEEVQAQIAQLKNVRVQPVYEIEL